ncbi:hypothetical protein C5Y96_18875 [Blastopirellula marina]|uniref:GYF domain-containing protein n=1 Tax=Blastopirellula marina TaxID=124 RepID=A0A2S8F618_9BACT|nr:MULTISPECIES: DUF4339 domain-containing protein [Pirellulaceae]PQO27592.1 hypothetical protein C5Y96_18875 [Blastopirellula marina]RCS48129.1 DUF4339 domain-containing protein [Bremerella cremea]
MKNNWYYKQDGKQYGPVDSRTLKQLADEGKIHPNTLVMREGQEKWVKAEKVKGLFPEQVALVEEAPSDSKSVDSKDILCYITIPLLTPCCFPVSLLLLWLVPAWSATTKWIWTGGIIGFLFLMGVFGMLSSQADRAQAANLITDANALWNEGSTEEAISVYRDLNDKHFFHMTDSNRSLVLERLIDFEAQKGNRSSALKMLERAENFDLVINLQSDEGKKVLAAHQQNQAKRDRALAASTPMELKAAELFGNSTDERVEFGDNPSKFKGKAVRMKVAYDKTINTGSPIQREVFNIPDIDVVECWVYSDSPNTRFPVIVDIPREVERPQFHRGDDLEITFFCEDGSTQSGNIAIKVSRH